MSAVLPPHVVVINDEQDMLAVLRELLEAEGYRVSTLTYPVLDRAELRILAPDLIILDMLFGGEAAGWHALQRLRLDRDVVRIPVIVCTAATHLVRDAREHLTAMDIGVVLKPFDIDRLLEEVRRRLSTSSPQA